MTPIPTSRIDAVVTAIGEAVADARRRSDRRGWFAAMYGQTTKCVRAQVAAGGFDDAGRMEEFVTRFAGRYLGPLGGGTVPRCWQVAFDAAGSGDHVILQHLLLGINAHVNLDLAVTAAEIAPGDAIHGLHDDFMRINAVLAALMPKVRACVGRFSPLFDVLDRVGGGDDDEMLRFSIRVARDEAWQQAVTMALTADDDRRAQLADSLDRHVAVLARMLVHPGGLLQRAVDVVAATESDDVVAITDALGQVTLDAP
jgi:hypothetical protein